MNPLVEYKAKRNFSKTPEPPGKTEISKQAPIFSIQKHDASHLHFDLRLEYKGILKSWAIPKGLSYNPEEKRLAIEVEDHPYDYWNFEGTIPEKNYGAGTVMVWDFGKYKIDQLKNKKEIEDAFTKDYEKGHLNINFEGTKIKGLFHLIRTKRGKDQWLIFSDKSTPKQEVDDRSALSKKDIKEISENSNNFWYSDDKLNVLLKQPGAKNEEIPMFIKPMTAYRIKEPFNDNGWLFEIKLDGYRSIAVKRGMEINLFSRNGKKFAGFDVIANALINIKYDFILDGEIVALDSRGKSSFSLLQNQKNALDGVFFYVFDLLYLNGKLLFDVPLLDRKNVLSKIVDQIGNDKVRYTDHIIGKGKKFFELAIKNSLEGIMAKNILSFYKPGIRSKDWLKIKNINEQEAVIGGYTKPPKGRIELGSLLLGAYTDQGLLYVGNVGAGLSDEKIIEIKKNIKENAHSPFFNYHPLDKNIVWVKPTLVCEVRFTEWTPEGKMRQPIFLGIRYDIDPGQVIVEKPI